MHPNVGPFSIYEPPKQVRVKVWVIYYISYFGCIYIEKVPKCAYFVNLPSIIPDDFILGGKSFDF